MPIFMRVWHHAELSNEVLHDFILHGGLELQIIKRFDFSPVALQKRTFFELSNSTACNSRASCEKRTIPHLEALIFAYLENEE